MGRGSCIGISRVGILRISELMTLAANVLLTANGDVKLADFGVSGQLTATMAKKVSIIFEELNIRIPSWEPRTGCLRR